MSVAMVRETHGRSVAKAVSYRLVGTVATTGLVFLITGRAGLSLAIGGLEFVSKIALFWMHERVWDRLSFGKRPVAPVVIWLTGLSGSGKTTLGQWVTTELRRRGYSVEHLDGDGLRALLPATGFDREARDEHARRVGVLAAALERNGVFVVVSLISPYAASRAFARAQARRFVEVYMSTPLTVCEARDVKGLYARARRGEITRFTGLDDPFEPPPHPEIAIDTTDLTVAQAGRRIMDHLDKHWLSGVRA